MKDGIEVLDSGQNRRFSVALMIEIGTPCTAPAESDDEPVATGLIIEERKPNGAGAFVGRNMVSVHLPPSGVRGSVHRNPTTFVPHRIVHDLAHEVKIVFVPRRADRTMQNRHRSVGGVPIGVDSPEIVDLRRIGVPVVSDADHPLESGKTPKLGQLHFAAKRGLVVFPTQNMCASLVILPIARRDFRRFDSDPLAAASLAALEGEGEVGDVTPRAGTPLSQKKVFPLCDKRHLADRRLGRIRLDRNLAAASECGE